MLCPVAAVALTLSVSGCGGDSTADAQQARQIQAREDAKRDKIERLIDGPNNDQDVVRSNPDGTTGKPLVWDLNRNGKIDRDERTITERELYDATLRPE